MIFRAYARIDLELSHARPSDITDEALREFVRSSLAGSINNRHNLIDSMSVHIGELETADPGAAPPRPALEQTDGRYRFAPLVIDNRPDNVRPSVWILRDDGYRVHARWFCGPELNLDPAEWVLVLEYKHCDYPTVASAVADAIMAGAVKTEREAIETAARRVYPNARPQ